MNNLDDYLANTDGCQFEEVRCLNNADCGMMLQRQYLPIHVEDECPRRKVDCQYCHNTGEYQGDHEDQCHKLPLPSTNKCSVKTHPENTDEHRKICPLEEVSCTNDCGTSCLTAHVNMGCLHRNVDCKYCHITAQHQFIEGEHKEQFPKLPIACPNKCEVNEVPRDDMEEHMKSYSLELIHCEYHEFGCEERVPRKNMMEHNKDKMDRHLSLTKQQLSMTNQELSDTKQQLATACHDLTEAQKERVALVANTEAVLATLQAKITEIETASQKRIAELETQLHQNTLQFESILTNLDINWLATLYSQSSKLPSNDKVLPVIVKMSEYTKKRKYKTHWYSEPFYTCQKGYKLCFQIDSGSSNYLSVGLLLMKGHYDSTLVWPMVGDFEVKLLNQKKNSEHFLVAGDSQVDGRKMVLVKDKSSYYVWFNDTFISHDELGMTTETVQYLRNDTIFFYCKL